ncbi:MAG: hypothetical protein EBR82_16310 [Caulobacteraceae bacterium]|nr:hypothetical protein [Caulobacteraceae bacterium]
MPKKTAPKQYNVTHLQPDEINALRALVNEFVEKVNNIDNELELLRQDRKEVIEEYSDKLDMKTLQAALRVAKIQKEVAHRDTFDLFMEALDPTVS